MFNIDTLRLEDPIHPLGPSKRQIAEQAAGAKAPVPARGPSSGIAPKGFVITSDGWMATDTTPPVGAPPKSDAAKAVQEAMASNGEDPSMAGVVAYVDDDPACRASILRAMDRGASSRQRFAAVVRFSDEAGIIRAANVAGFVAAVDALQPDGAAS